MSKMILYYVELLSSQRRHTCTRMKFPSNDAYASTTVAEMVMSHKSILIVTLSRIFSFSQSIKRLSGEWKYGQSCYDFKPTNCHWLLDYVPWRTKKLEDDGIPSYWSSFIKNHTSALSAMLLYNIEAIERVNNSRLAIMTRHGNIQYGSSKQHH